MEERAGERRRIGGRSAPLPNPLPARASRGEGEAGAQVGAYFNASGAAPWAEEYRAVGAWTGKMKITRTISALNTLPKASNSRHLRV